MLYVRAEETSPKIIIVGAGGAGIAAATKLLENGYNDVIILEAQDRIGGRVYSIPYGTGYIDLGAQWCEGEDGNVVYELVKNDFEFGDNGIRPENCHCYNTNGILIDQDRCAKLLRLSESITHDFDSMAKSNESLGEFFKINYQIGLQRKEFEDIDKELADQMVDLTEREINTLYASESWLDISAKLNSNNGAGDKSC